MVDSIHNISQTLDQESKAAHLGRTGSGSQASPGDVEARRSTEKIENEMQVLESRDIDKIVDEVNDFVSQVASTRITFAVDEATGRSVIRVMNRETGDMIRQLPAEELLDHIAKMEQLSGLIFSQEI